MTRYTLSGSMLSNTTDPDGDFYTVSHVSLGLGSTPVLVDWVATPVKIFSVWAGQIEISPNGTIVYDDLGNGSIHPPSGALPDVILQFKSTDSRGGVSVGVGKVTVSETVVAGGDTTAPTIVSRSFDAATNTVTLTHSEAIQPGIGNLVIRNVTDNNTVETLTLPGVIASSLAPGKVTILGTDLKYQPTSPFAAGKTFASRVAAGMVKDLSNNGIAAISDDSLSFSTAGAGGGVTEYRGYVQGYVGVTTGDVYLSPSGSDANPGTLASPKLTVANAMITNPGKTILMRGGKYRQKCLAGSGASGTSGTPTILSRYGTEEPILTGREVLSGMVPCVAGDASAVGARWANIYKITLADTVLPINIAGARDPVGFAPAENGVMLALAAELVTSPAVPVEPYNANDWPTWETIASGGKIIGYRNTAITNKYTQAQIEAMIVCFYRTPNLADYCKVASFDTVNNIINLTKTTQLVGVGIYANRMSLKNCVSELKQGQWGFVANGNGTTTYYIWPKDSANIASNMEYCARMTCFDITGVNHIHVKGLVFEGTGGNNSGSKDADQPTLNKGPASNNRYYNCEWRQHYRLGPQRDVFAGLWQEVNDLQFHNCSTHDIWGMYGHHPQGKTNATTYAAKTKGLWFNQCLSWNISSSAIRIYQMVDSAITNCASLYNVGMSPHANVHDPKQGSHNVLAHGCDWSGSTGYITYQQASAVHVTFCYAHGNTKGDDKRVIWDQSGAHDSPAFTFSLSGLCYWWNNHFAPDVQDLASWNAIFGGVSAEVGINCDNSILFNALDKFISGKTPPNITRGNKNVVPQGTAVTGEITEARTTTYEDIVNGDFRIKSGSAARTTAGNSASAVKTALLNSLPFLPSNALDKDINNATIDWANPPIGPVVGGVLDSLACHFIDMPALSSGTLVIGQTLVAGSGNRQPANIPLTWQWIVSTDLGYSWSDVLGAISSSFLIPSGSSGKRYGFKAKFRSNEVIVYIPGAVA